MGLMSDLFFSLHIVSQLLQGVEVKGQGPRTRGKEIHTVPLENIHSDAHSCLQT